ncbi:hypothetical protein HanLR1_Chr16g0606681 [Helianthus annuus]|nr:hypothetical protein HanHA89_Chr16g0645571 [Helianthus annuus]KAJ0639697.1 hypothetical protein HanLR1_Chr16g0606681 [Helianthus annuus]
MALCTGTRLIMVERCPNFETEYVQSSSLANRKFHKGLKTKESPEGP